MQLVYDVLQYKTRHEKRHGPISAAELAAKYSQQMKVAQGGEAVSKSFIDIACTVQSRILSDDIMRRVLLTMDDMPESGRRRNPFDGISKLQALIDKARKPNATKLVIVMICVVESWWWSRTAPVCHFVHRSSFWYFLCQACLTGTVSRGHPLGAVRGL